MILKILPFKPNIFGYSSNLNSLRLLVEVLAVAIGWLALVALLSHGGAFFVQTFAAPPLDVDLPVVSPDYDQDTAISSALVLGGCAAVVAIVEVLRRRRRDVR